MAGTLIPPHAPIIGGPWTAPAGSAEIGTGGAVQAVAGTGARLVATCAADFALSAEFDWVTLPAYGYCGVLFRYQDPSNYWFLYVITDPPAFAILIRRVAGTNTTIASSAVPTPSGQFSINVTARANSISVQVPGWYYGVLDSSLQTATGCGIYLNVITGALTDIVCNSIMVTT